jgi:hypothetical protein
MGVPSARITAKNLYVPNSSLPVYMTVRAIALYAIVAIRCMSCVPSVRLVSVRYIHNRTSVISRQFISFRVFVDSRVRRVDFIHCHVVFLNVRINMSVRMRAHP